ncbi:glycoside hydrolase family 15 protein [Actinocorallia sp. API 0066]|uniref:glycoside hydrolase family 15 protein n=1 Tax=Actinocorallia sp. API 0066 TaxID=2896846 RepID=UPI001E3D9438|nr:glycoside hydrolase family 15 protein [Actinocorallia sp. API 0066]MCD0448026.1 glycoside hydrolase family 15 protein [Actinocorallia sp. API 0066]
MSRKPIADHALLSDCRTAALTTRDGSVDWLCLPRFDAPSQFAGILDDAAGHWSIRPSDGAFKSRRYVEDTLVLETVFEAGDTEVVVTDALALGLNDHAHGIGAHAPHLLVRVVECRGGDAEVDVEFEPRPEYGLIHPLLTEIEGGISAYGGADRLILTTPVPLAIAEGAARGRARVAEGGPLAFALHHAYLDGPPARVWSQQELLRRLARTEHAWRTWSDAHQAYEGPWREEVRLSGRVLQALTCQPTGAIVAAPTTSLPEAVGGERNWDYRFTWVRDASLTMGALWVAACPDEATRFFSFLTTTAAGAVDEELSLQIMFGVDGRHDLTERSLKHLDGWRSSRPVRVGNGAWDQRQHDVYGELLAAARRLADYLTDMDDATRAFLVACADAAAHHWRDPDQGIWEVRGEPRHYLHSKVMCWAALDHAVALADLLRAHDRVPEWTRVRDEIHAEVLRRGWHPEVGAFTRDFDSTDLDASALTLSMTGFLPGDDPRVVATIDAIAAGLTDKRGLVHRYRAPDGLEGDEGTFLLCTFWLAHALALAGRKDEAVEVFERTLAYGNDLGLFSEEIDSTTGEHLGNFPQAFSHIGLVNAAWAISQLVPPEDLDAR